MRGKERKFLKKEIKKKFERKNKMQRNSLRKRWKKEIKAWRQR